MALNRSAFLSMLGACEGAGYHTLYGGGTFEGDEHPNRAITAGGYTSTAAGRYQILAGTWRDFLRANGTRRFDQAGQDECALWLIERRGALADVDAGRLEAAIAKCGKEWASLPGSPYGQPTRTLAYCLDKYTAAGGTLAASDSQPAAPAAKGPSMGIIEILAAFGPLLADLLPKFASIFKPAGEVANRNIAAAQVVVDTIVKATGSPNVQGAIEAMREDDSTRAKAQAALENDPAIMALVEVGGGIVAARASNIEQNKQPLLRDRAFLVSLAILGLVTMVVVTVAFRSPWFADWTPDNRTTVLQSVLMALAAVTGFFLGSSWGSSKKDDVAAARGAS